jgi:hypothetical protein
MIDRETARYAFRTFRNDAALRPPMAPSVLHEASALFYEGRAIGEACNCRRCAVAPVSRYRRLSVPRSDDHSCRAIEHIRSGFSIVSLEAARTLKMITATSIFQQVSR